MPEVMIRIRIVAPNRAPTRPRAPPIEARSSDSVSTCRTMRRRPAPSETRTAISCWRAAPRASSRPPMLAHASSSRMPTIAISSDSGPPNWSVSGVESPARAERHVDRHVSPLRIALRQARRCSTASSTRISARACAIEAPGFTRASSDTPALDRIAVGIAPRGIPRRPAA